MPVRRGRHRIVLAMLLLNAGRVVSADQLAEALWGQELIPPDMYGCGQGQARKSDLISRQTLVPGT